jgi:GNAT superfamily N-acetyltransferase
VPVDDARVPDWLLPFGGEVLMAFDPESGAYIAGVGIKVHDEFGHELAVVTEDAAQGRGLARRLVAQAGRRVIEGGAVPTYLHADANVRSAKVAVAAGFPDVGWRILGASGARPPR